MKSAGHGMNLQETPGCLCSVWMYPSSADHMHAAVLSVKPVRIEEQAPGLDACCFMQKLNSVLT